MIAYRWLICHLLHITPREQEQLSPAELHSAVKWIDDFNKEQAKGA